MAQPMTSSLGTLTRRALRWALACGLPLFAGAGACYPDLEPLDGSCRLIPETELDCRIRGYTEEPQDAGLLAYACTGSMRPDLDANFVDGVPIGLMCSNEGKLGSGEESYS
jgi:hypothetical protein